MDFDSFVNHCWSCQQTLKHSALILLLMSACTESPNVSLPTERTALTNQITNMADKNHQEHIKVVLSWENLQEEIITAPTQGQIDHVLVQDNQQVQAGQRLAQFKAHTMTQAPSQVIATHSEAEKKQAYQKWQQDKQLYEKGFVSEAAVAKSHAAYVASQKNHVVKQPITEKKVSAATWLQAPFNGVIKRLAIESGKKVQNGQELLVIAPTETQRVQILVAQENTKHLFVGQRLYLEQANLWLQIHQLPPTTDEQYVLAYAIWPQDLAKPEDLSQMTAYLVTEPSPLNP